MYEPMHYPILIEDYLMNRLTEAEFFHMQNILASDPLAREELYLQQDIISAICATRKAELKFRLNCLIV
jgi:hypothetical protein